MTPAARTRYHAELWPAACHARKWNPKDDVRRRATALECMRLVRGPQITTSDPAWGDDETTALFCYLEHLAAPADLSKSARWVDCQADYRAYNRARQADWHQRQAYGRRGGKLIRDRFAGAPTAQGEPLDKFDPEAIRKRHITMAARHRKRFQKQAPGVHREAAGMLPAGQDLASTPAPNENPF